MPYLETLEASFSAWLIGSIQVVGLVSAWLARMSEGSPSQAWCQRLFFGSLLLVGFMTLAVVALGTRYWLFPGATLATMILAAVWDFRVHARIEHL